MRAANDELIPLPPWRLTVADEKKSLRAILTESRAALPPGRARALSEVVQRRVIASDFYRAAAAIVLYSAIGNEVSTGAILADALAGRRAVFFPRLDPLSGAIAARRVSEAAELAPGAFGILEPPDSAAALDPAHFAKVLVCVPGVAFGIGGRRLGRGGGHYDRFLSGLGPEAISVGLAFSFQLLDRIPQTGSDRRLNFIVTESAVHRAWAAPLPARGGLTEEVHPGGSNHHRNPGVHSWWRGPFYLGDVEAARGRR